MNKRIPKFTIVIPARNEEGAIVKTLEIIGEKVKTSHNIIVIDDRSTDETKILVKRLIRKKKNLKVFSTTRIKNGFSSALELGFKKSKTSFVVVVMADLCDNPKTIDKMYKKINEGWDVVCGSRYVKGGRKEGGPVLQGFFSKLVCNSLYFFGVPTKDASNAFKMYRKKIIENVVFNPTSGVEASMEVTLQAFFNGAKIIDLPTSWRGRTVGKSKFKIIQRTSKYMRIFFWILNNLIRKRLNISYKTFTHQ